MVKTYCDCCKKESEDYYQFSVTAPVRELPVYTINGYLDYQYKKYFPKTINLVLCPACYKKFQQWLGEESND